MSNNLLTVTEIQNNKVLCSWVVSTLAEAIEQVLSLKITGVGKAYAIENQDGTVVEVIRM